MTANTAARVLPRAITHSKDVQSALRIVILRPGGAIWEAIRHDLRAELISLDPPRQMKWEDVSEDAMWTLAEFIAAEHDGMQDTHQHRIPKASWQQKKSRISLTFRGLTK